LNIEAEQIIKAAQTTSTTTHVEKQTSAKSTKVDIAPTSLPITQMNAENVKTNNHQMNTDDQKYLKDTTKINNDNVSIHDTLKPENGNGMIDEVEAANQKTFNFSVNNYIVVKRVIGQTNYSSHRLIKIKQLYIEYRENLTTNIYNEEPGDTLQERTTESSSSLRDDKKELYKSEFERWNSQRLIDGLLCRNDSECSWLDRKLICKTDVRLNFDANDEWLNDWSQFDNRSIGVCYCTVYHVWSEEDMECWHPEAPAIPPPWAIAIAVGVVLLLIVKLAILLKLMI